MPVQPEWFEGVIGALFQLVILSFLIERALYFVFDYSRWRDKIEGKGVRAPVAFLVSWLICWWHDFDAFAPVLDPEGATQLGIFLTALVVAGGSAAAIKLFQDVLGFGRTAQEELRKLRQERGAAELAKIEAEKKKVQAEAEQAEAQARKLEAEAKKAEAEAALQHVT